MLQNRMNNLEANVHEIKENVEIFLNVVNYMNKKNQPKKKRLLINKKRFC